MDHPHCNGCKRLLSPLPTSFSYHDTLRRQTFPSPPEQTSIKEQLSQHRAAMDELDQHILALQRDREALQRTVSEMESLLAPIRRIPIDILTEIWEHVVLFGIAKSDDTMPNFSGGMPAFHQVSKVWRDIAISTPMLWRYLVIPKISEVAIHYSTTILERSQEAPLSVLVRENPDLPSIRAAIAHSGRWKSADFYYPTKDMLEALEQAPKPFHNLEALCLGWFNDPVQLHVFNDAPRLNKVVIYHEWSAATLSLPWRQLTFVVFCDMDPVDCPGILALCPNLSECHILDFIVGPQSLSDLQVPRMELLHLRRLALFMANTSNSLDIFMNLFLLLTVPSLQDLDLSCFESLESWVPVAKFLSRTITCLDLNRGIFTTPEILDLFFALPLLRKLIVIDCYCSSEEGYSDLINLLLPSTSTAVPLPVPSLLYLEVGFSELDINQEFGTLVARVARSRQLIAIGQHGNSHSTPCTPEYLNSITLRTTAEDYQDGVVKLRGLVDEGFDVRVFSSGVRVL